MTTTTAIRPGFRSVTPYLQVTTGADRLIGFLQKTFEAETRSRMTREDGSVAHAELLIGDSVVELADVADQCPALPVALHVYLEDCDAAYDRAMAAGATSIMKPADMDYGDREGDVKDAFGNNWYIATRKSGSAFRPEGFRTVTPGLNPKGADKLVDFVKVAFAAVELDRHTSEDGVIRHATIQIGDSVIEISEAHGPFPPMPCALHLYLEDADAAYQKALDAGATSLTPPADTSYGDRAAGVTDAFGNIWYLASYRG